MLNAIQNRRSIRSYLPTPVPRAAIEEILKAGMLAPSSKNRQPWKFIVTSDAAKAEALECFQKGIAREKVSPLLPESAQHLNGALHTLQIMQQAPVVIFVINPLQSDIRQILTPEQRIGEICNAQSVGAAIENMTLTATELGLGSLWICDTCFAHAELCSWLEGELCAALAVGYAAESPHPRPRKRFDVCVEWRE